MSKLLILPDIHGRTFWKNPCKDISKYDKVIFLGDYMDPYDFEKISVEDAFINFEDIIDFANANTNKVILLLGNHDMPYFSKEYKNFSWYHCRHSEKFHNDIAGLFTENKDLFQIAYQYDDILFTHAGVTPGWLKTVFTEDYKLTSLNDLVWSLNNLVNTSEGLKYLYMVSKDRGGRDQYASCIWADVSDTMWYQEIMQDPDCPIQPIMNVKQVYGHTLQSYYNNEGNIDYGRAWENNNNKMLDTACAYELDTETYTIKKI